MALGRAPAVVTTHRFFVPRENLDSERVRFPPEQSMQLERVLRLRTGERVIALDGSGVEYEVILESLGKEAVGRIIGRRASSGEPGVSVDLYAGTLKGSKFETVLQKGTEVGVSRFIPILTDRSVAGEPSTAKMRRYDAIAREAAEQSRRGRIPTIQGPMPFDAALAAATMTGTVVVLWEDEDADHLMTIELPATMTRVALFVGPEGGFTGEEVALARSADARIVTLGSRILRAETAGIVGPAILLARLGELG